jgi:PAS domain-containing protein
MENPDSGRWESLAADEGRYRLLVEAVIDYAIFMLDRIMTTWDPGAQRLKGYDEAEIMLNGLFGPSGAA